MKKEQVVTKFKELQEAFSEWSKSENYKNESTGFGITAMITFGTENENEVEISAMVGGKGSPLQKMIIRLMNADPNIKSLLTRAVHLYEIKEMAGLL